ncbi:MAG TPA: UTRA domain-containing protein, partial [Rhodoglobus sp.]|nr:UTRA domain-containing protein [Rhodoglobus sp.]
SGTARIEALAAPLASAKRLDVPEGTPILVLSQVHELVDGSPVMYSIVSLRSDVMNLYVHRGPTGGQTLHESTSSASSERDDSKVLTAAGRVAGQK